MHLGDLGIEGREAFDEPPGGVRHNLYVCWQGSLGLANHLALRDHLRAHADVARDYGALKLELAARHADDIDAYIEAKTAFIVEVLRREQLSDAQRDAIARANRRPPPA